MRLLHVSLGFTRHPKLASLENKPLRQIEALGIVFSVDADMAQLVEHHLAKVRVAGSNPVVRSRIFQATLYGVAFFIFGWYAYECTHD